MEVEIERLEDEQTKEERRVGQLQYEIKYLQDAYDKKGGGHESRADEHRGPMRSTQGFYEQLLQAPRTPELEITMQMCQKLIADSTALSKLHQSKCIEAGFDPYHLDEPGTEAETSVCEQITTYQRELKQACQTFAETHNRLTSLFADSHCQLGQHQVQRGAAVAPGNGISTMAQWLGYGEYEDPEYCDDGRDPGLDGDPENSWAAMGGMEGTDD